MAAQNPLPAVYHYPPEFMAQLMPEIIRAHVARGGLLARRKAPRNAVKDHRAGQCRRPRTLAGLAYPLHGRLLPRRGWPQWIIRGWLALESSSVSYGKATPYLPLIDLLRVYLRVEAGDDTRTIRAKVAGTIITLDEGLQEAIPPLFLEDSVRTLVEPGALTGSRGAYRFVKPLDGVAMPATVQAILAARIDRLAGEDKRLLQAAGPRRTARHASPVAHCHLGIGKLYRQAPAGPRAPHDCHYDVLRDGSGPTR